MAKTEAHQPQWTIWKLRQGADKRVRSGHPWVFSNELIESPKGHLPGAPVELQDYRGQFVARGYGNPHSLIAFRALGYQAQESNPLSFASLQSKLIRAWQLRRDCGFKGSFRLCFGESDYIPGLVIDYYLVEQNNKRAQVFAVQILTAGMAQALAHLESFMLGLVEHARAEGLSACDWEHTAVVLRNDVNIRKLEGLNVEKPNLLKQLAGFDLQSVDILLNSAQSDELLPMACDLVEGQKTGFFLDQTQNIYLALGLYKKAVLSQNLKRVRILDLCCYVGHWSTQLAAMLKSIGVQAEVHLVDVSKTALAFAKQNAQRQGAEVHVHEMDVLEGLSQFADQEFDLVIADPPAFIKAKKDIPTGKHAYVKMNTQAFRVTKKKGFVVSCSCSGLLTEEEFRDALRKASLRITQDVRSVLRGGHAADHPTLMQFPEGFYLKMYMQQV